MDKYPIYFKNCQVGMASVNEEGLYYYFICSCSLQADKAFKIFVRCGDIKCDLGICVPENGIYTLRRHIPKRQVGKGQLQFAVEIIEPIRKDMVVVRPDKPFVQIASLSSAKLLVQNGRHYIYLENKGEKIM